MRLRPACTLVAVSIAACGSRTTQRNTDTPRTEPDGVDAVEVVALAVGPESTCVLRSDGEVWCVGAHVRPHMREPEGVPSELPWKVEGLPPATAIAAASESWCAIARTDGRVWCWGDSRDVLRRPTIEGWDFRPLPVEGLVDATRIFGANGTACAERRNGAVQCWGRDFATVMDIPQSKGALEVALAPFGVCVQPRDAAPTCWKVAGDHVESARWLPDGVSALAGGTNQIWYLTGRGRLGTAHEGAAPDDGFDVELDQRAKLVAGGAWLCAIVDGRVSCSGAPREPSSPDPYSYERRRREPADGRFEPVEGLHDVVDVQLGHEHACALTKGRRVLCWGAAGPGALGTGASTWVGTPRRVALDDVHGVFILPHEGSTQTCFATGGRLVCTELQNQRSMLVDQKLAKGRVTALVHSGVRNLAVIDQRRLLEWGERDPEPRHVDLPPAAHGAEILAIAEGYGLDPCLLLGDGSVTCLGPRSPMADRDGRLVDLHDIVELRGGQQSICARSRDATVRCWERSDDDDPRPLPTSIDFERASSFALGGYRLCAITPRGVDCDGEWERASLRGASRLEGGPDHMCGLFEGKRLRCVGQRPPLDADVPEEPLEVVIGTSHACARGREGVYCWGDNRFGQLGDGRSLWEPVPVDVTDAFVEARR